MLHSAHLARRAAFTLVEIMVVVVIIGLLGAVAVPAIRASRNTSVEKLLLNDARQISAAANIWFTESSDPQVSFATLCGASGTIRALSAGTILYEGKKTAKVASPVQSAYAGILLSRPNDAGYPQGRVIALCNPGYSAGASRNPSILAAYDQDSNVLNFAVDTGLLLNKDGKRILSPGVTYATAVDGTDLP